jgi:hypothetical protein
MDNLVIGQKYFVTEYETKIDNKEIYSLRRAKYLGKQNNLNEFIILTNVNWIHETRINNNVSLIPSKRIIKMENLQDITNEMLPNDILLTIDEYI